MHKSSRRFVLAVAFLAVAMLLAACGGSSGGGGTPMPPDPDDPPVDGGMPEWATGVISGELGGERFTVYTFIGDAGLEELSSSATWQDGREFNFVNVDLLGQQTNRLVDRNGAVTIEIEMDGEFVQRPVTDPGNTPFKVTYWESLSNAYVMDGGSVVVEEAELVDEDTLRLKGTFAGTVVKRDLQGSVVDTKELTNGTFNVPKVVRESLDL